MVDVSIIIVNYNTWQLTVDCIKSIFSKTTGVTFEVIVVDNSSFDNSVYNIRTAFPSITIIESGENLGFGRANNLAALQAKGKYLFFLNSDTLLVNDAVSILKSYMDIHPNVAICGGNLYDKDMNPNHSYLRIFPSIFNDIDLATRRLISRIFIKNMQFNKSNVPLDVAYITGADMMIRKDLFENVSGFDSDFFLYYEETELTYRLKSKNYRVVNVPSAKIIHLEGKSSSISDNKMRIMQESRLMFFRKSYSMPYCTFASINYIILNVASIIVCSIFNRYEAKRLIRKIKIFFEQLNSSK
jgi:GT2 family glycosyltransferase